MTLAYFGCAFDAIFVVVGGNRAGAVVEVLKMRNRWFNYPDGLVQAESGHLLWPFDDFAELTVSQIPSVRISDVRTQSVSDIRQN
jgi:hypothetical protein